MALQLALGCASGVHRTCCPCCPGEAQIEIASVVASSITCSGLSEDEYNGIYQVECPTPLEYSCSSDGGLNRLYYKITVTRNQVEIVLTSNYFWQYVGPFPSGLIQEQSTQFRRVVFDFANCPNASDVGVKTVDFFSVTYLSVTFTPGSCTPGGPTTNNYTYGSITQTETTTTTCPGAGERVTYQFSASGDTADLFIYGPGTLIGNDYWKWLGNLRNADIDCIWI